jgi:hypothetical protein
MKPVTLSVGPIDFKCLLCTDFGIIDAKIAQDILALNVSNGLPLLSISNLAPMPPISGGCIRSKFMHAVDVVIQRPILNLHGRQLVQRGILTNDKIRVMPSGGG